MFPSPAYPADGVFVAREVDALRRCDSAVDVEVVHVDTVRGGTGHYITGASAVARASRQFRPDVVHAHYGLTQIPAYASRHPLVVTFHGSDLTIPWQRAVSSTLAPRADACIAVSPHLVERLPLRLRKRTRIIGCGVDTRGFTAVEPEPPLDTSEGLVLGFPASADRPGKDYALFEAVASELRFRGITVSVAVFDRIEPDDMPSELRRIDFMVMTSRFEGSPVITREAMCCGKRVVSVDVGDMADQLAGVDGCAVVNTRRPEALAEAIVSCSALQGPDPKECARRFTIEREASAVISVYREVLK